MAIEMFNDQMTTATVPPIVDSKGNPASVDGVIEWSASDATKVILEPSIDGMTCDVKGAGPSGSVTILARADADLGPSQSFVFWTGDISINARQAVGGDLGFSAPVDQ